MQHTIQHLFRVNSLEEVSRERLEELVANYPSFSVGRYLLSRKLHAEQDGHFSEETQKTNLYFTNPFWLQWLLQNDQPVSARTVRPDEPRPEIPVEARAAAPDNGSAAAVEAPLNDGEEGNGVEPASGEIFFQENLTESEEAAPREDVQTAGPVGLEGPEAGQAELQAVQARTLETKEAGQVEPQVQAGMLETKEAGQAGVEENPETADAGVEALPSAVRTETGEPEGDIDPRVKALLEAVRAGAVETPETVQAGVREGQEGPITGTSQKEQSGEVVPLGEPDRARATSRPIQVEEPGVKAELSAANTFSGPPTAAEALLQHLAEARGLRQTLVQMNEGASTPEEDRTEGDRPLEAAVGAEGVAQPGAAEQAPGTTGKEGAGPVEDAARASGTEAAPGNAGQTVQETPTSPVQEPSTAIVAHAMAMAEPVVEFEPYHTIDYFASVGIKFVQDENPSDKLGKQLKSFTDWLKVMRKLPQKNQEIVPDMAAEHQIQAIAAHSIKGKEVLTETMAEVLVKQGMREKAVEVYHKLSLLNPDKSAYFAAKIEQLKID